MNNTPPCSHVQPLSDPGIEEEQAPVQDETRNLPTETFLDYASCHARGRELEAQGWDVLPAEEPTRGNFGLVAFRMLYADTRLPVVYAEKGRVVDPLRLRVEEVVQLDYLPYGSKVEVQEHRLDRLSPGSREAWHAHKEHTDTLRLHDDPKQRTLGFICFCQAEEMLGKNGYAPGAEPVAFRLPYFRVTLTSVKKRENLPSHILTLRESQKDHPPRPFLRFEREMVAAGVKTPAQEAKARAEAREVAMKAYFAKLAAYLDDGKEQPELRNSLKTKASGSGVPPRPSLPHEPNQACQTCTTRPHPRTSTEKSGVWIAAPASRRQDTRDARPRRGRALSLVTRPPVTLHPLLRSPAYLGGRGATPSPLRPRSQ